MINNRETYKLEWIDIEDKVKISSNDKFVYRNNEEIMNLKKILIAETNSLLIPLIGASPVKFLNRLIELNESVNLGASLTMFLSDPNFEFSKKENALINIISRGIARIEHFAKSHSEYPKLTNQHICLC